MNMSRLFMSIALLTAAVPVFAADAPVCPRDPALLAALDTEYQAAVEKNDAAGMDRLLADDFVLVNSRGEVYHKADLLTSAQTANVKYEHQSDTRQTVRFWDGMAVVTALLWIKGVSGGNVLDFGLWFSDVYLCTDKGWRYSFGQAGARQPKTP
jgi:hypothetical protein